MKKYKTISVDEVIASLPKKRQEKIAARGAQLLAEIQQRTLAELRKERNISQATMAEALGINQVQVSRLERRKDLRLSTLQRSVASMGGHLTLIATFPDREPIVLLSRTPEKSKTTGRARSASRSKA